MSTGDIRFCSSEWAYILKKDDVIVINFSKEGSWIEDSYKISNEWFKKWYTNAEEIIDSFAGTNVTKE